MGNQTRAAVYCRISHDPTGQAAGVDRQEEACREHVAEQGWALTRLYVDNDRSAMSGRRPEFERMISDLDGIDVIVVWSADRLYRRLKDLERLVDALGRTRVVAMKSGSIDLSTADGKAVARILGALSQRESEKLGERVAAAHEARVRSGGNGGGRRPMGFTADRLALVPDEAELVRAAHLALLSGGSLNGIARQWRDAGVKGTLGGMPTPGHVRDILLNPLNAGLVTLRGEVVATTDVRIVDAQTHREVVALIRTNKPRRKAPQSLLAGIAACSLCGGPMRSNGDVYRCADHGHLTTPRARLDEFASALAVGRLSRNFDATMAAMIAEASPTDTSAMDALGAEMETLRGLAGVLSDAALAAAEASVRERMAAAQAVPAHGSTAFLNGLREAGPEAFWRDAPTHAKRQLLGRLLTRIVVGPRGVEPVPEWSPRVLRMDSE